MTPTRFLAIAAACTVASTSALAITPLEGCYRPAHGFATSLCNDSGTCQSQTGIYRVVLINDDAPRGKRRLILSGMLQGLITEAPNHCGGANLQHLLMEKGMKGSISTGPDEGCPTGGGDFVNTLEITETLSISQGEGIYENIVPGGTITLKGTLGLISGANHFKVDPQPNDQVCFSPSYETSRRDGN